MIGWNGVVYMDDLAVFAQNVRKTIEGLNRRFLAEIIFDRHTIRHDRPAATIVCLNVELIVLAVAHYLERSDNWFDAEHFSLPNRGRVIPFAI